ncbi:MAG: tRNA (adenosine(37)-N6)-dimethylallyltransferase MiaA [Microbacteriaceae bacterium]
MSADHPTLIAIIGPTGTGKSALSLEVAQRLGAAGRPAEILNADAMQLYRGMDIGTAKLPVAERRGIPHHLLDVLEVSQESTVAAYQVLARRAITEIVARGAVPILVGGSGLYVSAVLFGFTFPGTDRVVRGGLEAELAAHGVEPLYLRLQSRDPVAAAAIDRRNARRVVRALEVIELTGRPYSAALPAQSSSWLPVSLIGLRAPRPELVARLDERVEDMWRDGFLDEVRWLIPAGIEHSVTASRAIGYAQALAQLAGRSTQAEAIASTQLLTRRYARRQMSWFRRLESTTWLDYDDADLHARAFDAAAGEP